MHFLLKIFFVVLLFSELASFDAQAQSPFPFAKGNVWYYTYSCEWCQQPIPAPTQTVRVIGDTLLSNGNRYWILEPSDLFRGKFIRSDTNYVYYAYQKPQDSTWYERKTFNFHATNGDIDTISLANFMTASARNPFASIIFNKSSILHGYDLGGLIFGDITIADGFGYYRYEYRGDEDPPFDIWQLTGCIISDTLYGNPTSVSSVNVQPVKIVLYSNFPNPFNGSTIIKYTLSIKDHVRLTITNILGQQVSVLMDEVQMPGMYTAYFHPNNLSSGIYFCNLSTSTAFYAIKILYLK
jgi:hypothetical protein